MVNNIPFILHLVLFIIPVLSQAQDADAHFSQFIHTPLFLNPALAGAGDAQMRVSAAHRRQWETVPVPYLTFAAAGEAQLPWRFAKSGQLAAGVSILHDEAGDGDLSVTAIHAFLSSRVKLNKYQSLSVGLSLGGGQRAIDGSKLKWGSQFDGELFNPTQIAGEIIAAPTRGFTDLSGGLNWHLDGASGISLDIGAGAFHLNRPDINFLGMESQPWSIRLSSYAIGVVPLSGPWQLRAHATVQMQGTKREILAGTGVLFDMSRGSGQALLLGMHLTTRFGDAVIPAVELHYGPWTAGLSFDVNTSGFESATNRSGGPEIILIHTIRKVKPPELFESCPIY